MAHTNVEGAQRVLLAAYWYRLAPSAITLFVVDVVYLTRLPFLTNLLQYAWIVSNVLSAWNRRFLVEPWWITGLTSAVYPVRSAVFPVPMEPSPVSLVAYVMIHRWQKYALKHQILFVVHVQKTITLILLSLDVSLVLIVAIVGTMTILENAIWQNGEIVRQESVHLLQNIRRQLH